MNIRLYKSFSKRKNSTKQPSGTYTQKDVKLKEKTSVNNPTFLLTGYDPEINYIHVPLWGKYYFVDDVVLSTRGLYEVSCSCDILASYKTQIGNLNTMVIRSSSTSNGEISDGMYPITGEVTINEVSISGLFPTSVNGGSFILGVVGDENTSMKQGTVTYYAMTEAMLRELCSYLFSSSIWQQIKNDYENPLDYIVSCYWVPYNLASGTATTIKFGRFTLEDYEGYKIVNHTVPRYASGVSIPKHPQASTRGNFLNLEPYSLYNIWSPGFGFIPLQAEKLKNETSIALMITIDVVTGQAVLEIVGEQSNKIINNVAGQVGVPVTLSQNAISIGSLVNSGVGLISSIGSASVGNVAGAIVGGIGAIQNGFDSLSPNVKTNGANGSFICLQDNNKLIGKFRNIAGEDNAHLGRPLCSKVQLSTIPGYILCKEASIDISGHGNDKEKVNSFLNSGFYYE